MKSLITKGTEMVKKAYTYVPSEGPLVRRVWAMPSKWTFECKPIKKLLLRYVKKAEVWVDPFAGYNSPATVTNDIEPDRNAQTSMDALEFLRLMPDNSFDGCLFDPPYSTEQCLRKYTPKHGGTARRAEYWAKCKDELSRLLKGKGISISFGWDSTGLGKKRGHKIIEILLVCHGACHNDTIITVERKL